MAKKSRNNRRRSKGKSKNTEEAQHNDITDDRRHRLASLLESAATQSEFSSTKDIELAPVDKEFSEIIQKFAIRETEEQPEQTAVVRTGVFNENEHNQEGEATSDNELEQGETLKKQLSKRQQKIESKPSIGCLKASVPYPELIEWFDCDARSPYFNAQIKTSHNIVQIPRHWQNKRGYLSGRSLMDRKPFELPDIIKQTNIEAMRNTLPTDEDKNDKKLKDLTRARVQPKLGALDLDYTKLHDAFFKLGKNWKPELLSFGDYYYENRNLESELEWKAIKNKFRPGHISPQLRDALNLPEGMLPPWCKDMKDFGLPSSYPGIKVCGINLDISKLTSTMYAYWPDDISAKNEKDFFGSLISLDELVMEDNQADAELPYLPDPESEEESFVGEDAQTTIAVDFSKDENKQIPNLEPIDSEPTKTPGYDENRPLFTVLKQTKTTEASFKNYWIGIGI